HDALPISSSILIDTVAPDTTTTAAPPSYSASTSASFSFTASDPSPSSGGLTFLGSLDGAAFTAVASGVTFSGLSQGSHTFAVEAVDVAGNVDATPAASTWTVDPVAPGQPAP